MCAEPYCREPGSCFLSSHGGRYTYIRTFTSWVGFGDTSRVKVEDGTVVEHAYRAHDAQEKTREAWIERGDQVGSHGREAQTMGAVYARCLGKTLRRDPERYTVRVSFFDDGILATCSFRDRACADDCNEGLSVEHFHFGDPTVSKPLCAAVPCRPRPRTRPCCREARTPRFRQGTGVGPRPLRNPAFTGLTTSLGCSRCPVEYPHAHATNRQAHGGRRTNPGRPRALPR